MNQVPIEQFATTLVRTEDGQSIRLEPWQGEHILDPVFNDTDTDGLRRINLALIGLPKKNGKSTLASIVALYGLLGDGEPEPEVYGAAGSKDQAKIIFRQTIQAIQRNPVLENEVHIFKDAIERKDGRGFYRVLSADAPKVHGLNPHMVIWDELWNQRGYDLWEALTHSPARRQPLHFCVTYAGFDQHEGNLLWDLYQRGLAGSDLRMHFYWTNDNHASWVTDEYLAQQKQRLPEHIYRRLHCNEWTSGAGAFLTREDVDMALDPALGQQWTGESSHAYAVGVDLGLTKDATVVTTAHLDDESGNMVLDNVKTFQGSRAGKVRIEDVEAHLIELDRRFNRPVIVCDPWQAVNMVQRLKERGLDISEFTFSTTNITKLTQNLFTLFKDRRIRLFDYPQLVKELVTVRVIEKAYGYRIDHESGSHDDHVISLGLAALQAVSAPRCEITVTWVGGVTPDPWQSVQRLGLAGPPGGLVQ